MLNDLVQLRLNVTHEIRFGKDVHKSIAEPKVEVKDVEHRFEMNQIENCLRNRERPSHLCAEPIECDGLVSTVLPCELLCGGDE